jgi:hypothetical protein
LAWYARSVRTRSLHASIAFRTFCHPASSSSLQWSSAAATSSASGARSPPARSGPPYTIAPFNTPSASRLNKLVRIRSVRAGSSPSTIDIGADRARAADDFLLRLSWPALRSSSNSSATSSSGASAMASVHRRSGSCRSSAMRGRGRATATGADFDAGADGSATAGKWGNGA